MDLLAGYIRRQDARLVEALYVPVEKRVLRRVLAMSRLYGDGAAGTVIPLTQDILASMAGTTRPTANQVLRSAEQEGLISMGRAQVRIEDPRGLAKRADRTHRSARNRTCRVRIRAAGCVRSGGPGSGRSSSRAKVDWTACAGRSIECRTPDRGMTTRCGPVGEATKEAR